MAAPPHPRRGRATPAAGRWARTQQREPRREAFLQVAAPAGEARCPPQTCRLTPAAPPLCGRQDVAAHPGRTPGSALPHSSRLRSLSPRSRGALGTPSPSARRAPSFAFCHPTALPPRALGGRAAPLAGPQEARAVAWVLPARNRFTRDQLPGWETVKTCLAEAAANRYPYFLPLVASPRPKLLPPPIWQKPQSFLVVNLFPQAPSPAARQGLAVCRRERRLQLFARVAKCKKSNINCLLLQTHNLSP